MRTDEANSRNSKKTLSLLQIPYISLNYCSAYSQNYTKAIIVSVGDVHTRIFQCSSRWYIYQPQGFKGLRFVGNSNLRVWGDGRVLLLVMVIHLANAVIVLKAQVHEKTSRV